MGMPMTRRRGIQPSTPQRTMQNKISTEPPPPCKQKCGRRASTSRKDQLCDNCGVFRDRAKSRKKA